MFRSALTACVLGLGGLLAIQPVSAAVPVEVEVIPSSTSQIRRAIRKYDVLVAQDSQVPVEVFTVLFTESGTYTCEIYATSRIIRNRRDVIQQQKQVCYDHVARGHSLNR